MNIPAHIRFWGIDSGIRHRSIAKSLSLILLQNAILALNCLQNSLHLSHHLKLHLYGIVSVPFLHHDINAYLLFCTTASDLPLWKTCFFIKNQQSFRQFWLSVKNVCFFLFFRKYCHFCSGFYNLSDLIKSGFFIFILLIFSSLHSALVEQTMDLLE